MDLDPKEPYDPFKDLGIPMYPQPPQTIASTKKSKKKASKPVSAPAPAPAAGSSSKSSATARMASGAVASISTSASTPLVPYTVSVSDANGRVKMKITKKTPTKTTSKIKTASVHTPAAPNPIPTPVIVRPPAKKLAKPKATIAGTISASRQLQPILKNKLSYLDAIDFVARGGAVTPMPISSAPPQQAPASGASATATATSSSAASSTWSSVHPSAPLPAVPSPYVRPSNFSYPSATVTSAAGSAFGTGPVASQQPSYSTGWPASTSTSALPGPGTVANSPAWSVVSPFSSVGQGQYQTYQNPLANQAAAATSLNQLKQALAAAALRKPFVSPVRKKPSKVTTKSDALAAAGSGPVVIGNRPSPPRLAYPLLPPNWQELYDQAVMSLSTSKFPVDATSLEYQTIVELLNPTQVVSVEKTVNPDLWQRYSSTRRDMIRAKTDDLDLLSKMGLDEKEVLRAAHMAFNFYKDPLLETEAGNYSTNEVLLFHCTRNQANLEKILAQGLDERLSSITGGLLGKGIYFADDPEKSKQYDGGNGVILIFSVLLGDCLSVDHIPNKNTFVREPEKEKQQRRNFNDQFFDSITAMPAAQYNEFVIYNRYQCCPLYLVKYGPIPVNGNTNSGYYAWRRNSPTMAWRKCAGAVSPMPNQQLDGSWPFYAATVFEKMGVTPEPVKEEDKFEPLPDPDPVNSQVDGAWGGKLVDEDDMKEKLEQLVSFGFFDEAQNREVLLNYNNNVDLAANFLLDCDNNQSQPSSQSLPQSQRPSVIATATATSYQSPISTATRALKRHPPSATGSVPTIDLSSDSSQDDGPTKKAKILTEGLPTELAEWALEFDDTLFHPPSPPQREKEECSICCDEHDSIRIAPALWKELQCSQKVCINCYKSIETKGTTMSGVAHTSVRCPFCQGLTGIEVGDCPDGTMTVNNGSQSCSGYPGVGSVQVTYFVSSGQHQLNRTAYLPNNQEGKEVLAMLREAWDRRLVFVIGTSNTTGQQNVLVWNIHHKTAPTGGVQSHGYPDPGYLERVKWELKAYGIE